MTTFPVEQSCTRPTIFDHWRTLTILNIWEGPAPAERVSASRPTHGFLLRSFPSAQMVHQRHFDGKSADGPKANCPQVVSLVCHSESFFVQGFLDFVRATPAIRHPHASPSIAAAASFILQLKRRGRARRNLSSIRRIAVRKHAVENFGSLPCNTRIPELGYSCVT